MRGASRDVRGIGAQLLLFLMVLASTVLGACAPRPERVVLVTIDTLRADHVGAYGLARARTATIDALAANGARFETAIAPTPLTLPSHTSLMTGLEPPAHGVRHNSVFRLEAGIPTLAEQMRAGGFATAAFVGAFVLNRSFGLARGFDVYDDRLGNDLNNDGVIGFAERPADRVIDAALAWLVDAPSQFLLWVHVYDPHAAYRPPVGFAAAVPASPYDGEIAFADAEVGRLFGEIRARYPDGGTLFVVTSDHGESLGDHGEPTHSYSVYDATQRVPLVLSGPGIPRGRVVEEPVRLVDVAPTILSLVGLPPLEEADGRDLSPRMRDPESSGGPPPAAWVETLATQLDHGWSPLFGIRTRRYKYVRAPRPELYDLESDPGETRSVADVKTAVVAQLDAEVSRRLRAARPVVFNMTPDREDRARLESLGYLVPEGIPPNGDPDLVAGLDPKDGLPTLVRVNEINTLLGEGDAAEAVARLAEMPGDGFTVSFLRSQAGLLSGDLDLAERGARAVLAATPDRSEGWLMLGLAEEQRGRFAAAERALEAARRRGPGDAAPLVVLGRIAAARADEAGARRHFEAARAVGAGPPRAEATWRLAALEIEACRREDAEALLAELGPEVASKRGIALRLAAAEAKAGDPDAALSRLRLLLADAPDDVDLRLQAGALHEAAGRLEEALAARERALTVAPASPAARNDVAWSLVLLGRDLERSLSLAQEAATPAALDTLASVHLVRGEHSEALAAIERALAAESDTSALRGRLEETRLRVLAREVPAGGPAPAGRCRVETDFR